MNRTTTSAEQIARDLLALIPRLNRIVARELRAEFGDDATIVQMRVLGELSEAPLTLSELARKREVSVQAASEHIQCLVAHGWVRRTPDPHDRRRALLSITDAGREQLQRVRDHITREFALLIENLEQSTAEDIHRGLTALRGILYIAEPPTGTLTD